MAGEGTLQAVILAGGQGTRLRPLTLERAKPVVPLLNRPFLAYQLALLRSHGVTKVVVVGLATDYCVKETGLDGIRLGFDVTVLRASVRAVELEPGDGDGALAALRAAGAHVV